jgi:hypothetical protein
MASFKEAFADARKSGKKQFDFGGKSYSTDVAKSGSTPRYQSGALKGMRRDPNEGETSAERSKRLRAREQQLLASRPKPPPPKPAAKAPAKPAEPKGPSIGERLGGAYRAAAETSRAGTREAGKAVAGAAKDAVKEGKQLPGRAVEGALKLAGAPTHVSTFAGTLLGNRSKITDADDETKAQLKYAAAQAAKRGGKDAGLSYKDYKDKLDQGSLSGKQSAAQLIGKNAPGNIVRDKKGNVTGIKDKYDFWNPTRQKEVERYEKMGTAEKAATVAGETVKDVVDKGVLAALKGAPSRLANAYIGREGARDVDIKMAKGGSVAKPYKPSPGDLNEKWGGDQEMENREYMRKKAAPKPAPKPKAYAKGGGIEIKGKTKGRFV